MPDYVTAHVGDLVEIHCTATGSPEPRIEWTRGPAGDLPSDAVVDNGVLRFHVASREQQGVYECTATNEAGSSPVTVFLAVEEGPLFVR